MEKEGAVFRVDKTRKSGLYPQCKECESAAWRERYRNGYRERHLAKKWMGGDPKRIKAYNIRKRKKWAKKIAAQTALRNAVKSGRIIKKSCEVCGEPKSHGHHDDYSKPLEVRWLCDAHHKEVHGRLITPVSPKKKK